MSYILVVNPSLLAETGMPIAGAFVATALTAAICTMIMALVSNLPLALAPGMSLNSFIIYTVCLGKGFLWQEGLAVVLMAGLLHVVIMGTRLRKSLINAVPLYLKLAMGVGMGLFIAYIGLKNTGALFFTSLPGQYNLTASGAIISNGQILPSISSSLRASHVLAFVGLGIMFVLMAFERKTGESYAALPVGILAVTFLGIPFNITDISGTPIFNLSSIGEIRQVFMACLGDPGLLSLINSPNKLTTALLVALILVVTNVLDSIGTIIGIGQASESSLFEQPGQGRDPQNADSETKLDRAFVCNSVSGPIAAIMGTTTTTTYIESITGIAAGGRTGLTGMVVAIFFILCLPLANIFTIIPATATAPALIVAGSYMIMLVRRIDWQDIQQCLPAFMTILFIPLTFSAMHGVVAGIITHVIIKIAMGKIREVHPVLYVLTLMFILDVAAESFK